MPIRCEEYDRVSVMAISGDFSAETARAARAALDERVEQQQIVDFVLDFEHCGFIDSEGLETLLWMKRRCDDLFGQLKLANLDDNCRKILEMTRLDHSFQSHDDLPSALKMMR